MFTTLYISVVKIAGGRELHNRSPYELDLQGYILTDKADDYGLSNMLPDIRIPANGYVLLYAKADSDDTSLCLPFGL